MFNEVLPFWAKYWCQILLAVVSLCVFEGVHRRALPYVRRILYANPNFPCNSKDQADAGEENGQDIDSEMVSIEPALPVDLQHIPYRYEKPTEARLAYRACEFYDIVAARRSLRYFNPDPVPKEVVHNIIKAAGTSPSGAHTEPWTFVIATNRELKLKIRELVEREEEINYRRRMGIKWTTDLLPLRTNWIKEYLTVAPHLILVFKQTYSTLPNGQRKIHYYTDISVSIACGILITAIQYAGLVTLTSTPLNCGPAIRRLLGRPSNEKLVLLLPIGYPAEDATVPAIQRKQLSDILVEYE